MEDGRNRMDNFPYRFYSLKEIAGKYFPGYFFCDAVRFMLPPLHPNQPHQENQQVL